MSQIHIHRPHRLGLAKARKVAFQWAEEAERDFGMDCTYEEGELEDEVQFKRTGASGTLRVTGTDFELKAKLGLVLGAFRERIEAEIVKNLDDLLQRPAPRRKG